MASKGIYAKKDGAWRNIKTLYVNVGGSWFKAYEGWNAATGGTVTDVDDYNGTGQKWRVHTFTSNGTFTVKTAAKPFRVLVVGGGGGNGSCTSDSAGNGPGNGGAVFTDDKMSLDVSSYNFTIGSGGGARGNSNGAGGSGGSTTAFGKTMGGGGSHGPSTSDRYRWGKGSASVGSNDNNQQYSLGVASDINGSDLMYGQGGQGYPGPIKYVGAGVIGTPGTGGTSWQTLDIPNRQGTGGDRNGKHGAVIIAYQIG